MMLDAKMTTTTEAAIVVLGDDDMAVEYGVGLRMMAAGGRHKWLREGSASQVQVEEERANEDPAMADTLPPGLWITRAALTRFGQRWSPARRRCDPAANRPAPDDLPPPRMRWAL